MSSTRVYFAVRLGLKDYEFVVNEEHNSFVKFYIDPNSVLEERWVSRLSKTEEPKVFNIIKQPLYQGGIEQFVQIKKEMLATVSHTIFSNMLSAVVITLLEKNRKQLILTDRIASMIIRLSRKKIEETDRKFRNKSVLIAVKILIVTVKLPIELMKEIEENMRRNYNGSIPASFGSVAELERVKLEQNSLKKCVICFQEILAGSTMIRTKCSHEFHAECITEWFTRINLCPRCRFEMPTGILDRFLY